MLRRSHALNGSPREGVESDGRRSARLWQGEPGTRSLPEGLLTRRLRPARSRLTSPAWRVTRNCRRFEGLSGCHRSGRSMVMPPQQR